MKNQGLRQQTQWFLNLCSSTARTVHLSQRNSRPPWSSSSTISAWWMIMVLNQSIPNSGHGHCVRNQKNCAEHTRASEMSQTLRSIIMMTSFDVPLESGNMNDTFFFLVSCRQKAKRFSNVGNDQDPLFSCSHVIPTALCVLCICTLNTVFGPELGNLKILALLLCHLTLTST